MATEVSPASLFTAAASLTSACANLITMLYFRRRVGRDLPRGRAPGRRQPTTQHGRQALLLILVLLSMATNRAVASYVDESTKLLVRLARTHVQGNHNVSSDLMRTRTIGEDEASRVLLQTSGVDDPMDEDNIDQQQQLEECYFEEEKDDYFEEEVGDASVTTNRAPRWRTFDFLTKHVLQLDCSGDELTVRVMPSAQTLEETAQRDMNGGDDDDDCRRRREEDIYNRKPFFHAIFWSLPGEEDIVPVKLRLISPKEMETVAAEEEARKPFKLSADEVVLYRPLRGRSEVHILARDALGFVPMSSLEKAAKALQSLHGHGFVFTNVD